VTWPKPHAEEIYEHFNAYAATHPWVNGEGIRPKSIVREMAEIFTSFADYVKDLGLQRSEGVLLRYLSDAYKALLQNVPQDALNDGVRDIIAYLRAMLAFVDSSLLLEWEQLLQGAEGLGIQAPPPVDISSDRRSFHARVRAELHALVRAMSLRDWEEASACLRRDEAGPWGAEQLASALAPFLEEHGDVAFDHRARLGDRTVIKPTGPHQWTVRQVLLPPQREATLADKFADADDLGEDADAWAVEGRIDLRANTNPDGPLIELLTVGP